MSNPGKDIDFSITGNLPQPTTSGLSPRLQDEFWTLSGFLDICSAAQPMLKDAKYKTEAENKVFHRFSYQNWSLGAVVGVGCFAGLNGISYLYRRRAAIFPVNGLRTPSRAPSQSFSPSARNKQKSSSSIAAIEGRAYPPIHPTTTNPFQQVSPATSPIKNDPQLSVGDDIMTQLEMMVFGAISIFITTSIANFSWDQERFFLDVSTLPLQPGRSSFCHVICPQVISYEDSLPKRLPNGSNLDDIKLAPEVYQLDYMFRLVHNCRSREALQEKSQSEEPVEIPEHTMS